MGERILKSYCKHKKKGTFDHGTVFYKKWTSIFQKSVKISRKDIIRALRYMQDYKNQKEVMNMEYKKFNNQYVIRIDKGEEICAKLKEVAQKENIKLS